MARRLLDRIQEPAGHVKPFVPPKPKKSSRRPTEEALRQAREQEAVLRAVLEECARLPREARSRLDLRLRELGYELVPDAICKLRIRKMDPPPFERPWGLTRRRGRPASEPLPPPPRVIPGATENPELIDDEGLEEAEHLIH